jgi:hypothetical protein
MGPQDVARLWLGGPGSVSLLAALCEAGAQVVSSVEPAHGTVGTPLVIGGSTGGGTPTNHGRNPAAFFSFCGRYSSIT